jgi:hypothetical protein
MHPDPARHSASGVEACGRGGYAKQVTALHHGQLAVHIGEAGGMLVPFLGEGGVGGFAEELHCTGIEQPQGFQRKLRRMRFSGRYGLQRSPGASQRLE